MSRYEFREVRGVGAQTVAVKPPVRLGLFTVTAVCLPLLGAVAETLFVSHTVREETHSLCFYSNVV